MNNIQDILPHRYPFFLIDKVMEVEKNKWAKGYKNVSSSEWYINERNGAIPSTLIMRRWPSWVLLQSFRKRMV